MNKIKDFNKKKGNYTKSKFLEDLKKVCQPVKKNDKHKPSSGKT